MVTASDILEQLPREKDVPSILRPHFFSHKMQALLIDFKPASNTDCAALLTVFGIYQDPDYAIILSLRISLKAQYLFCIASYDEIKTMIDTMTKSECMEIACGIGEINPNMAQLSGRMWAYDLIRETIREKGLSDEIVAEFKNEYFL